MRSFRQLLFGRRAEIFEHIRCGTYGIWLVKQAAKKLTLDPIPIEKVRRFRERKIGNRRFLKEDIEMVTSLSAIAPRDTYGGWTCEQRLWAAVLIRAIYDLVHFYLDLPDEKRKINLVRLGREAHNWFESSREDEGAYLWVCQVLDMPSPNRMREIIYTKLRKDLPRQCSSRKKK